MAHFAKVKDGKVLKVIVADQEFVDNYIDHVPGTWIQTSYNTRGGIHYEEDRVTPSSNQSKALRYNYASIDGWYDYEADAFYEVQPYPSWTLSTSTYLWESPIERPNDGNEYLWNEETQQWELIE